MALIGWDVTIKKELMTRNGVGGILVEWCKKWAFQLEEGHKTGYQHWQVRLKLLSKMDRTKAMRLTGLPGRWSPTSKKVHTHKNFNYVLKADSRVDGPWTDQTWVVPQRVTRQLRTYRSKTPYRWQRAMEHRLQIVDDRGVCFIRNFSGNKGKTVWVEDLCQKGLALRIPPLRNCKDILQMVFSFPDHKIYMIDMPRAMQRTQLYEFYEAVETIKGGWVYDTRNKGRQRWMDRPQICIFANMDPDMTMLSKDMWELYDLHENKLMRITWDFVGGERHEEYYPFEEEGGDPAGRSAL